ncbi:MAG: hypothetical protein QW818_03475 [Candidatus Aenigmatarchaeota archaeon]|nr:hypothetical protein [Candidatus Aenigmarchaeota archaeon]
MNTERVLTLIYFILGVVMGILSNYLNLIFSLSAGVVLYIISFFITKMFVDRRKKFSWFVLNTLVTFVLIWFVTWIFVFNL